ncbi:unnamed protein product [Arctia plantaginis]|uniref:MADF domain-containing protein n=1 Tax=Arctia plantaginis TaxID=874455 RepID=A0A8S1B126_ARCPL|nr:unnamed protein product [Arctia plantaginis]CAB3253029.1 unnamed protein product [Arctia plantaginis]
MECNTVEFFIEKVRDCPCLWNMDHVSYRDMARKDLAWERVAKECNMSNGREAKIQWKKLRDSHREALRRRKPSSGISAQNLKPWKYEEKMKFVLTKTEVKESAIFWNDSNDTHNSGDNLIENNVTAEVTLPEPVLPMRYPDPLYTDQEIREEKYRERHERRMHTFDMNRSDGLSKLFDSFCQKTRELPKYLQLRVQREIFDTICRAEEEALSLNLDPINAYSPMSSSSPQGYTRAPNIDRETQRDGEDPEYERKYSRQSLDC